MINSTPFNQGFLFAIKSEIPICASIMRLLRVSCPTYISDFIMTIIVDTVKGMFWGRTSTNVSQKFFKRSKLKFNTTPTIIIECLMLWILTAIHSVLISSYFWRRTVITSLAMSWPTWVGHTVFTRGTRTFNQRTTIPNIPPSTIAPTEPQCGSMTIAAMDANYDPFTKPASSQILKIIGRRMEWTKWNVNIQIRHSFLLIRELCLGLGECLCTFSSRLYFNTSTLIFII